MNIFTVNAIPMFISEGGVGSPCAAQIKFFDVYYVNPPVVGFHVVGYGDCDD